MSPVLHAVRRHAAATVRSLPLYNAKRSPDSGALHPDRTDRLLCFSVEELPPDEDLLSYGGEDDLVDEE